MSRPLTATIDLSALRHNYALARRLHGGKVLAILKANGYGHGAVRCAEALAGIADGFGVAAIEEAIQLREAGVQGPILLLEGWFEPAELALIERYELWTALHSLEQIDDIEAAELTRPLTVWVKIDSGMHRLGLAPADFRQAHARLLASGKVGRIVAMTHFSRADELDCATTPQQHACFVETLADLPVETSLCNSGGILGWPALHGDWGRAGVMLYGGTAADRLLPDWPRPVMNFDSRIIAVRELAAGEPIGYGGGFVTERPTRVGVVACGYADGYPRVAPAGTPVLIDGQRGRLIGRVSMDMLTVDLNDHPAAGVGTPVRLWGEDLPACEVAAAAGTIDYELFCNVKRAAFVYHD
ncbi:alanine racemase [Chitinimonas koreensis]|uniref:alanine racemase n=1 Tax=Chitinimonas koreensis TaxID=356302 RepID=UPI000420E0E1|nr:alanine racemase [Chitinimonas koreensis]QNM94709.1 alanine racemase [Chitinimonas koreensis]